MKKILFIVLLLSLSLPFVSSQNCQYTETHQIESTITNFYLDGQVVDIQPPFIEISEVRTWKRWLGFSRNYEFFINNLIRYPVEITLFYTVEGKQQSERIRLDPFGTVVINGNYNQNDPGVNQDSIYADFENIQEVDELYLENIEVCKMCNGQHCLNDGSVCKMDSQCGSEICNIAGVCGTERIVNCPNGLLNCNNQTCLSPSTKLEGEAYSCVWECQSGFGEDGICKNTFNMSANYIFLILGALILGILAFLTYRNKNWFIEKKQEIRKTNELKKINNDFDAKLDAKLEYLKKKHKEILDTFSQNEKSSVNIQELKDVKQSKNNISDVYIKKYLNEYGSNKIYFDQKDGYIKWKSNDKCIHINRYKIIMNPINSKIYDIHHIDKCKVNNELHNLIALTRENHDKIKHYNIVYGDWKSGIQELQNSLNLNYNDFHKHIKKKFDELGLDKQDYSSDHELEEKLKKYRLSISKKENKKPFTVFSNKTLKDLIKQRPKTIDKLILINGLGPVKIQRYGEEIIRIINFS